MAMDYTITAIAKPSREVRLTIHLPTGDRAMSFQVPEGISTLAEARDYVEGRIKDAVAAWRSSQPVAPAPIGTVLDGVVGVRRTVDDA